MKRKKGTSIEVSCRSLALIKLPLYLLLIDIVGYS